MEGKQLDEGIGDTWYHSMQRGTSDDTARQLATADFNGDGKLDLAAANLTDGTLSIFTAAVVRGVITSLHSSVEICHKSELFRLGLVLTSGVFYGKGH